MIWPRTPERLTGMKASPVDRKSGDGIADKDEELAIIGHQSVGTGRWVERLIGAREYYTPEWIGPIRVGSIQTKALVGIDVATKHSKRRGLNMANLVVICEVVDHKD